MSDVQGLTVEEQRVYEEGPTLLAAAQRCNRYVASDYTPVYVEDVKVRSPLKVSVNMALAPPYTPYVFILDVLLFVFSVNP